MQDIDIAGHAVGDIALFYLEPSDDVEETIECRDDTEVTILPLFFFLHAGY